MSSTPEVVKYPGASLVERAKDLAPVLQERAAETSNLRRLPDATWSDLITSGILRGLQPSRWGGGEVHPREFYGAIIEIARAEGCAGWVAGIVGVHPWETALYPKETQEEVWGSDPRTMNSSSFAPTGKAELVAGGYRLNGRWSFSSGCDHCGWVNLGAIAGGIEVNGQQLPNFRSYLLPRKDYRIDDNWHVAGLAGTGSKDIVAENAFVPEHRSISHWDMALGRPMPGWEVNPGPLYRLPFGAVFFNTLTAAILGGAAGLLETWIQCNLARQGALGQKVAEDPFSHKLVAEASYTIAAATLKFLSDCDEMMTTAEAVESFSLKRRAELRYSSVRAAEIASYAVEQLFEAGGGHAIFLDHPLQRRYQDVKAMMHHGAMNPNTSGRLYGAAQLNIPIMDPFL